MYFGAFGFISYSERHSGRSLLRSNMNTATACRQFLILPLSHDTYTQPHYYLSD